MSIVPTNGLAENDIVAMDSLIRPFTSLPDLLSSPSVLSSEASLLTTELTNLCHASHSTFLQLHDTSRTLSTSFSSLSSSIDSLISTIPSLHTSTQRFTQTTKPILEERRKAGLILEQQEKLLDLLEIPTLIDTCARNGLYQDAMELWSHASALLQQFKIPGEETLSLEIMQSLEKEIEGSIRLMAGALVDTLRGQAKLPALHKVVGFLRSMSGWREDELAVLFLSCRAAFIESMHSLNEVAHSGAGSSREGGKDDTAKYLRSYIEVFREGIYDVVTAYTAIFIDHDSQSEDLLRTLRYLLATFTDNQTSALLTTLSSRLPTIHDFTSLSSLLTPLTYCGTAFSRIGLDFRPLLSAPFEQAVLRNVKNAIGEATNNFINSIMDSEKANIKPSNWLISNPPSTTHSGQIPLPIIPDALEVEQPTSTHIPPPQVLTFSPLLATLLNSHLTTFNALRLLPILSLLPDIYELLSHSLSDTANALLEYSRSVLSPASPAFRMSFERPRTSISLERKNSEVVMSPTSARSMSPSLQRSSMSTSTRPTARQVYTGDDAASKREQEMSIVLAVGKAHVRLLVPFLQRGLVQGVYHGAKLPDVGQGTDALNVAINQWEMWLEEQKPKAVNGTGAAAMA
jgi:conserved oligomeric Golgi complex subunit 8